VVSGVDAWYAETARAGVPPPDWDLTLAANMSRSKRSNLQLARPDYGIDAPGLVLRFFVIGVTSSVLGGALVLGPQSVLPSWTRFVLHPAITIGIWFLLMASVMLWGSTVGKLRLRDKVIDSIDWRGDEMVLDVGCGHGLMLIGAAKRLRTGKAIGVDLWQTEDQAGNSRAATMKNVELEKVSDRIELIDGDARSLPFPDNHFDVVLSSWALHNIYDRQGRDRAIREIIRGLKPNGRLAIVDIRHTNEYAQVLRNNGLTDVHRGWPNFLFFIPSHTLTAKKAKWPERSDGNAPEAR
jgi:arsenite methyltransferase